MVLKIQDTEGFFDDMRRDDARGSKGEAPPRLVESFDDLDSLRQLFSPGRILLYRVLRRRQFDSVYALAKFMRRDYKAVVEDLKVLRDLGLLRFAPSIVDGRARSKPVLTHKTLVIEFG